MSDTIQLEVTRIRTSRPSGWGVASGKTLAGNENITIVGVGVSSLSQGDRVECTGDWTDHPTYGRQMQFNSIKDLDDPINHQLIYWLKSLKGIGPAKATDLEATYRTAGFESMYIKLLTIMRTVREPNEFELRWVEWFKPVCEKAIERSKSFGPRGLACVVSAFKDKQREFGGQASVKDVRDFVNKLWETDPYDILNTYYGFKEADVFILKNNVIKPDADIRIKNVLNHLMLHEPDTIHELNKLHAKASNEFAIPVWDMYMDGSLKEKTGVLIIEKEGEVYLQDQMLHDCEQDIKSKLVEFAQRGPTGLTFEPAELASMLSFKLTDEQMKAVQTLVGAATGVLTGGAGTGKTTIMRAMLKAYRCSGSEANFRLAAPTNKAARRLSRQTGVHATSIHKLLDCQPFPQQKTRQKKTGLKFDFAVNETNPIKNSLIIVDEMSMVDTRIMAALMRGIDAQTCQLLMVGDHQQLPPIQEGQPFVDIMEGNSLPEINTFKLERIMRQNPGQLLSNASSIRLRQKDRIKLTRAPDWEFVKADDDETIRKHVIDIARKIYHENHRDPFSFQIITPRKHAHRLSTIELNKDFRLAEFQTPNYAFVVGDKGLCTGHSPFNLINGDVFKVEAIDQQANKMTVLVETADGPETMVIPKEYPTLTQGWAITIHKFQGDEAPYIIIPVSRTFGGFLSRSMLYTAITRGQKKVILVGQVDAFMEALDNEEPDRLTGFKIGAVDAA